MTLASRVKKCIPASVLRAGQRGYMKYLLRREARRDVRAYAASAVQSDRYATPVGGLRELETQLTKDYHRVEKGLALGAPKRPFGIDVARRLDQFLPVASSLVSADQPEFVKHAMEAREALSEWNEKGVRNDVLSPAASAALAPHPNDPAAFAALVTTRRSVRHFDSARIVSPSVIDEAVRLASNTPSVCNRQPWQVHVFEGQEQARRVLGFQNGNRAFRHEVKTVLVITVDARLFAGAEERNQPWIEGGLFAAHLALALHAAGVATCLLNMSARHATFDALRSATGIPANELIVMMVAVGYPAENHRIARSPRRNVEQLVTRHEEAEIG